MILNLKMQVAQYNTQAILFVSSQHVHHFFLLEINDSSP